MMRFGFLCFIVFFARLLPSQDTSILRQALEYCSVVQDSLLLTKLNLSLENTSVDCQDVSPNYCLRCFRLTKDTSGVIRHRNHIAQHGIDVKYLDRNICKYFGVCDLAPIVCLIPRSPTVTTLDEIVVVDQFLRSGIPVNRSSLRSIDSVNLDRFLSSIPAITEKEVGARSALSLITRHLSPATWQSSNFLAHMDRMIRYGFLSREEVYDARGYSTGVEILPFTNDTLQLKYNRQEAGLLPLSCSALYWEQKLRRRPPHRPSEDLLTENRKTIIDLLGI